MLPTAGDASIHTMLPPNPNPIHAWPLPYEARLALRNAQDVDLIVIHCTELPDMGMARAYGERIVYADTQTGASGHYYVDRDGATHRFVDPYRVAHHTRGFNDRAIGIELVNLGRYPNWLDSRCQAMTEPYPDAQIQSLLQLLHALCAAFPALTRIAGHAQLDRAQVPASNDPLALVARKVDPGPLFPWRKVLAAVPLRAWDTEASV